MYARNRAPSLQLPEGLKLWPSPSERTLQHPYSLQLPTRERGGAFGRWIPLQTPGLLFGHYVILPACGNHWQTLGELFPARHEETLLSGEWLCLCVTLSKAAWPPDCKPVLQVHSKPQQSIFTQRVHSRRARKGQEGFESVETKTDKLQT